MDEDNNYGEAGMIKFVSFRERLFYIAIRQVLFALRFARYDCGLAAEWGVILWRVLRWAGNDRELEKHKFLGAVGRDFGPDVIT